MALTQNDGAGRRVRRRISMSQEEIEDKENYYEMETALHVIKDCVYYSAKSGMAMLLFENLEKVADQANSIVNEYFLDEDGQSLTPFVCAAKNGHVTVLKMLLEKFKPDLEVECTIKFDGSMVQGVTALWCASSSGHLEAVKTLIKNGAKVNHVTRSDSTPLRAACFIGRLDIVKYLAAHGGDINLSNTFNNNCLMIASYKGFLDVVEFLLENGADASKQANCGATALHYAAESGHVEVCSMLLDYGAELLPNEFGFSPVIMSAERLREEVVEMFIERADLLSLEDKINTLELMGASFANDKDQYSVSKAHYYLMLAMVLRYKDPQNIVRKTVQEPVSAYEDWVESQTIEELEAIRFNYNSLHMESLAVRERILGSKFPDLAHQIIFRGAVCADNDRFDRCESLWLHALQLRQLNNVSVHKDLLRFAQVYSQMYHLNYPVKLSNIVTALKSCVLELLRNKERLANELLVDLEIMEEYETNITTTLYLITIATKILRNEAIEHARHELDEFQEVVVNILDMDTRLRDGQTLLHLAVNGSTPVDNFHTNDVCRFPCVDTVRLLLCCNSNMATYRDTYKNTPLHILMINIQKSKLIDIRAVLDIVEELLRIFRNAGTHIDAVNAHGHTATQLCPKDDMKLLFRQYESKEMTLKCLSCRTIVRNRIPYQGYLHTHLEQFVKLHSPGLMIRKGEF